MKTVQEVIADLQSKKDLSKVTTLLDKAIRDLQALIKPKEEGNLTILFNGERSYYDVHEMVKYHDGLSHKMVEVLDVVCNSSGVFYELDLNSNDSHFDQGIEQEELFSMEDAYDWYEDDKHKEMLNDIFNRRAK